MEDVHAALLDAYESMLDAVPGATFERRDGYVVRTWPGAPMPTFNAVWTSRDGEDVAAAVAELRPTCVVVVDDAPLVLAEAQRLGLVERGRIPGMLVRREDFRPISSAASFDLDALDEAHALIGEVFDLELEWFRPQYTRAVLERANGTVYTLRDGGEAVSTALSIAVRDAVVILNVATPAAKRGRGYGGAVTSRAIEDAFADGARYAVLQTSRIAEPVYRRLGFERVNAYTLVY